MHSDKPAHRQPSAGLLIRNARVALPGGIADNYSVLLQEGRIAKIGEHSWHPGTSEIYDADGMLLTPGFLDLHSDAIEKEIKPRPGGCFPLEVALTELDKRLAACGVTSMYHCLCCGESQTNDLRTARRTAEISRTLRQLQSQLTVRNRVHVRFEVTDLGSVPALRQMLAGGGVDLFSFMDHTPGQGQFRDLEHFRTYYSQAEHLTHEQADRLAQDRMTCRNTIGNRHVEELAAICRQLRIPIASHDDDTPERVRVMRDLGVGISEFPVRLPAAREAVTSGMDVLMGAPNILRGGSLTGNLSGQEAVRDGCCTVIGSDYAPMSILHAIFQLHRAGILPLHQALLLATGNPARALGLADCLGAIREGYLADLLLIEDGGTVPRIVKTFVEGREVFSAPRLPRAPQPEATTKESHVCI